MKTSRTNAELATEVLGAISPNTSRKVSPLVSPDAGTKLIAFGYYGGKFSHRKWILPILPVKGIQTYVEPFGGSAAILLNRPIAPVEVYNDLDRDVTNFFRVLRDSRDELMAAVQLTPFSREEFALSLEPVGLEVSNLERARRFYIRARQSRTGLAQTATLGRWANCRGNSRRGIAAAVSRWLGSVPGLSGVAERMLVVQIENRPALEVISTYDSPDTLFYVDPPYLHETRGDSKNYGFEMSTDEHRTLAASLKKAKGKVVLSGYNHPEMDNLYQGWWRVDADEKLCHASKSPRVEAVWCNFKPPVDAVKIPVIKVKKPTEL